MPSTEIVKSQTSLNPKASSFGLKDASSSACVRFIPILAHRSPSIPKKMFGSAFRVMKAEIQFDSLRNCMASHSRKRSVLGHHWKQKTAAAAIKPCTRSGQTDFGVGA